MWEQYNEIIPFICVGSGVIDRVADHVVSEGYRNILVVCDPNTKRVAGERVIGLLKNAGLTVTECFFADDEPIPDERSIGILTAAYSSDTDLIMAVGSGTINDICTFVGARVGCPSVVVGTAPSMDGYASLGSAMLIDGLKVTPPTQCPVAIFCDIDILVDAPMLLTAAGLGDMLGKFTALADWRLANLLVGEPMPEDIRQIIVSALDKIVKGAPYLPDRDKAVIQSVTEGLILSGIAMSLYGDSRPASGTEHHLAHFWEMRMLAEGKIPALHGIKVGLATVVGLVMWKELADQYSEADGFLKNDDRSGLPVCSEGCSAGCSDADKYVSEIRRLYGPSAEGILQTVNPNLSLEHLNAHFREIIDIAKSVPSPEEIGAMLAAVGAPVRPAQIELDADTLRDSIIYGRDRKKIYTILQLLGDLGCLDDYSKRVSKHFANKALSDVKCYILDMDGTIYLGDKVFDYSGRFLEALNNAGKDHIFYTNNSSRNATMYLEKLNRMSIPCSPDKLLMSTHVLLDHLVRNSGSRVYIAGTQALRDDFKNAGYTVTDENPDFVVLGFDTDMNYERLTKFCDFVRTGLPYYGVHTDYNCPVEGGFIPDCGSLAAAVTAATGVTPEFFGKPSRRTLDYIIKKTGYREEELCFVGDRLYTDIAIATGTKAKSVLVLSGETKREDISVSAFVPDLIVNDLEELMRNI